MALDGDAIRDAIISEISGDSTLADSVQDALGSLSSAAWKEETSNSYHSLLSIVRGIATSVAAEALPTAGTPTGATPGTPGQMMYDDTAFYIYTATGWKSVLLTPVP